MDQVKPEAVRLLRVSLTHTHAVPVLCASEGAHRREVQHDALAVVRLALAPLVSAAARQHRLQCPQAPAINLCALETPQQCVHCLYSLVIGTVSDE